MRRFRTRATAWIAVLGAASGAAVLSGCALDPVGLAIGAASTAAGPPEVSVAPAYRGMDCRTLAGMLKAYGDQLPTMDMEQREAQSIHIRGVRQVMAEQGCAVAGAAPAVATPAAGPSPAPPATSEPQGAMGAAVGPVTAELAQAVGLATPRGLLVTALIPGRAADQSGIRGGDVILEVRGVAVSDAARMRRVLGTVPNGQSVLVTLWRARESREMIVGPITSNTPALPPGAVYADAPVLAPAPVRERFCVAQLTGSGFLASSVHSPLFTVRNDGSEAESAKLAESFLLAARKSQPGKWLAPHTRPSCNRDSKVCSSASPDSDVLMMLCETEREKGVAVYEAFKRSKPLTELAWSPPAS
ncbi:PDZ domain-containing protein [Azospirillum agricola]|uniref:PDZ domain-containing protein n=1 Tax=Azospirillum agricola TaxID=1720247 RepID=UPI000A0EF0AF|nr:PDZ domain-containing protein [Azospirillum agricola]SMH34631.1 serine protease Do [Azospirillum lipoferum]